MANYPSSQPSATPADHAEVLAEVRAIAAELGLLPKGGAADVTARLNAQGKAASGNMPGFITGRYYNGAITQELGTTQTLSNNQIRFSPFFCHTTTTFDRMSCIVTTAQAGANIRLGIYNSSAGLPGTLLLDATGGSPLSGATTGAKEVTISQSLNGSTLYWLAIQTDTASMVLRATQRAATPYMGHTASTTDNNTENIYAAVNYSSGLTNSPTVSYSSIFSFDLRLRAA